MAFLMILSENFATLAMKDIYVCRWEVLGVVVMMTMMIVARVQGPRPILLLHNSAFSPHFTPLVHDDHDD